jgi:hypothetical protein
MGNRGHINRNSERILCFLDPQQVGIYTLPGTGCSADGSAPRLGRGGRRFKSAHPDTFFLNIHQEKLKCVVKEFLELPGKRLTLSS